MSTGLCVALTLCLTLACAAWSDNTLLVKASTPWSVTGGDDLAQLKHLASGVGWEFEPNADTTAALRRIGIRSIRCINVDPVPGYFDESGNFIVGEPGRLLSHLQTCREVGADPHVIIAVGVHDDLRVHEEDVREAGESLMGLVRSTAFGPQDWGKFQRYCEALFEYVLITQGFPGACFEVGNEPDIGGTIHPYPPRPANGSRALYEGYFEIYRNVAGAARRFEETHPGLHVRLGGPALAWAFTFRFGDFNWADRFIRDCGEQQVKLDFIGVHFYGNIGSIDGAYQGSFPAFTAMLRQTMESRDRYCPGTPIAITEWGPSYRTDNSPEAAVNANHIGAAWGAEFLNTMLNAGVDSALYLVTTDLRQQKPDGSWETVWGWPSLFTNPNAVGRAVPKAIFHTLDMVSRLRGRRVEATRSGNLNCFAVADPEARQLQVLCWNYAAQIPEFGVAIEGADREATVVRVRDAAGFFGTSSIRAERWLVSDSVSNARGLFERGEPLDQRADLQCVDVADLTAVDGALDFGFAMPPSSVSLVTFSAAP